MAARSREREGQIPCETYGGESSPVSVMLRSLDGRGVWGAGRALTSPGVESAAMRPARHDDFRLPDLRFVPIGALVPHEQHDPQRLAPLVAGLRDEAVLKNPPVVAPLPGIEAGEPQFMVLDGANRSSAARAAGLPHIVVQCVTYEPPHVILSTWHHALAGLTGPVFEEACRGIAGLEVRADSVLRARAMLARREILAYAQHEGGAATTCRGGAGLEERNRLLNALVDTYRLRSRFYRTSTESFE